eukprot:7166928-Prymnesium_polylepis.2
MGVQLISYDAEVRSEMVFTAFDFLALDANLTLCLWAVVEIDIEGDCFVRIFSISQLCTEARAALPRP